MYKKKPLLFLKGLKAVENHFKVKDYLRITKNKIQSILQENQVELKVQN